MSNNVENSVTRRALLHGGVARFAVVEELELVPEFPVVVDVVAALATSAPPARSPELSAPTARTLRRRIFMGCVPFRVMCHAEPVRFGADTMRPGCWGDRRRA